MQIIIHADKTIERHAGLDEHVQTAVKHALKRFGEEINRFDAPLSDNLVQK